MWFGLHKYLKAFLILLSVAAIAVPICPVIKVDYLEKHFDHFSEFVMVEHDNIDDSLETHSHIHKHSEDGEEHEHDHEHTLGYQVSFEIIYLSAYPEIDLMVFEPTIGFSENNLISDPHSFGIFRPPRV